MKIALLAFIAFCLHGYAFADSIDTLLLKNQSKITAECSAHFHGNSYLESARDLYRISTRTTREGYMDYDGTSCDQLLRSLANGQGISCATASGQVIGALASCWDRVNRGCVDSVVSQYAQVLAQAGRANPACASQIEMDCRRECYPRFPSACNRSCAKLASYVR